MVRFVKESLPKEAYAQLQQQAMDLGEKGKDGKFGWGMVLMSSTCL
jgi:hypothetical protein